jgi:PPOX class probable F420-dependent enzyme
MSTMTTLDRAAAVSPTEAPFAALRGRQFITLTTYRKTGVPVATTVWFAEIGDRLYVTTEKSSGKIKRLRHTPRVQVTPCAPWGAPRGPVVWATARVLPPTEHAHALAALRRKYGWFFWVFERCSRGTDYTFLEVTPA